MTEPLRDDFDARKQMRQVVRRARFVLALEQLAIPVFLITMLALTYAGLSWLGLWTAIPLAFRIVAIIGFGAALLYVLRRFLTLTPPSYEAAIGRIETVSGVEHRPLTASLDQPATTAFEADSPAMRLWHVHQLRIKNALMKLKAGWPKPQIERYDPYALRTFAVLIAFIGFFAAGSEKIVRLGDIFQFSASKEVVTTRLDAWATPPSYTGRPPLFLTNDGEQALNEPLVLPENSKLTIRAVNADKLLVSFTGEEGETTLVSPTEETEGEQVTKDAQNSTKDYEYALTRNGTVKLELPGKEVAWQFDIVKDQAPTIAYAVEPTVQRSGAIEIVAILADDYGIVQASADITPTSDAKKNLTSQDARPLYEAPKFPLSLNRGRVKEGTSKTIRSIVDHPFSGAEVSIVLRAVDEAGLEGTSEPITMVLPERRFSNRVARALIEQRRKLALDANYAPRLANIIDALTVRPEVFEDDYGIIISLAAVRRQTLDARDDDGLRAVVDKLWEIATGLEDGNLSDAERNLRDALEALKEGIENGASEEELARLMQDAREAMREFMQALAEQARRNAQANNEQQQNIDPSQTLSPEDLERMLDQIGELAETGSRDAAQQLLSQLQQMMENLQANNGQQQNRGESQAQQMLNELGEMIRRQQELMDQTFRQQNNQNREGYQGQRQSRDGQQQGQQRGQQQSGNLEQLLRELQNGQQSLADQLQRFMEQMRNNGFGESREFGEAQRSMSEAARDIGEGDLPGASTDQGQALNELRRGAQQLSNQMAGDGQGEGNHGLAQGDRGVDPLGRQEQGNRSDFGEEVKVPDEIDIQRAREILDAIRRRLGETLRPTIELEYLERLLKN